MRDSLCFKVTPGQFHTEYKAWQPQLLYHLPMLFRSKGLTGSSKAIRISGHFICLRPCRWTRYRHPWLLQLWLTKPRLQEEGMRFILRSIILSLLLAGTCTATVRVINDSHNYDPNSQPVTQVSSESPENDIRWEVPREKGSRYTIPQGLETTHNCLIKLYWS